MQNFSFRLKELRLSSNLTQKQLSEKVKISERGIQAYELGEKKPGMDVLITLADYFNISMDYLVGRSDIQN